MNRYVAIGILTLFIVAILLLAPGSRRIAAPPQGTFSVTASFYPLAYFATEIGGNDISVRVLTPAGAEPHDYEPTTGDIVALESSRMLIVVGDGFEPWLSNLRSDLSEKNITVVSVGPASGNADPHIWLDPAQAQQMTQKITDALIAADPARAAAYRQRSGQLALKLAMLDTEFRDGLKSCKGTTIVTSHTAFGYLAARYGLTQVPIAGLSPEEEPSASKLADIADFVKQNNIQYIFFETLVSPRLAETIARETGARTEVLNPIEGLTGDEIRKGLDYFSVQRQNLSALRTALDCK